MALNKPVTGLLILVLAALALNLLGLVTVTDPRFQPSGLADYLPARDESFQHYVEESRRRIREVLESQYAAQSQWPFGPDYSLEKVVDMRAPFEIGPNAVHCGAGSGAQGRGFLLIHGLTDSPYLLSELAASLADRYPCATIRSLLIPGHGTVPGDLLQVTLAQWRQIVQYGVSSFDGISDDLYLVGYSNGAALAIDYLQENPGDSSIKGLIMLSPGLAAAQRGIALAPYLKYLVRWVSKGEDRDPVKYDSMPTNAAGLFYQLTRKSLDPAHPAPSQPVFMVMSGDDNTVDVEVAVDYFCQRLPSRGKSLIWYRSEATGATPHTSCQGVEVVDVVDAMPRYVSHSHVAVSMPPDNEHYGLDGLYPLCGAYSDSPSLFERCSSRPDATVYGENTLRDKDQLYQGKLVRRASFNPMYDEMLEEMACFIEQNCGAQASMNSNQVSLSDETDID